MGLRPDTHPGRPALSRTPTNTPATWRMPAGGSSRPSNSATVFDGEALTDPEAATADHAWHTVLAGLLGRLDAARADAANPDRRREPVSAARAAAAMVKECTTVVESGVDATARPRAAAEFAAAAARFCAAAAGPRRGPFGLLPPAPTTATAVACLAELPVVLEQAFALLGAEFQTAAAAMRWVDASGVFLADLRRGLAWASTTDDR